MVTRKLLIFRDLRYSQFSTIVGSSYLTVLNDTSHGQESPFCFVWNVQVNYSQWLAKNHFRALTFSSHGEHAVLLAILYSLRE